MWADRQIQEEVSACRLRELDAVLQTCLPKDAPVLEAGCGLGAWVIHLSGRGYDVTGVDNDPLVVERLQSSHPDLDVRLGDIVALPFADGTFGAVMSFGVVEHFPEGWGPVLAETRRVLERNGILVLTVPMNNTFRRLFAHPVRTAYLHRFRAKGGQTHFAEYRYSPGEVERNLVDCGFQPLLTTWEDFTPKNMSLGIWTDFPPLQTERIYEMNWPGRATAWLANSVSRRIAAASVLCVARKAD